MSAKSRPVASIFVSSSKKKIFEAKFLQYLNILRLDVVPITQFRQQVVRLMCSEEYQLSLK